MTKITPHQMRELANALEGVEDALPANTGVHIIVARDFLRTAADRLEAVQGWADHADPVYADMSELYAILTTDTAPQEGRDD